ncbi:MAG: homing endonuclease associated repeat-containing protein [Patescibacteria group bacterium]
MYNIKRNRIDKISREVMLEELERVAVLLGNRSFTWKEFNQYSKISSATLKREFGSFNNAIDFLAEHLSKKGIKLVIRKRKDAYTKKEIFDEIEKIWNQLGHRPSVIEWQSLNPSISSQSVIRHFNGWGNAFLEFIELKMGKKIEDVSDSQSEVTDEFNTVKNNFKYKKENSRTIPLGVRLEVLNRDNFKCRFCGKSPAINFGTELHIDHVVPFSKGGKSVAENLQTLCKECNLGKSDKQHINNPDPHTSI